jgi:nitrous oxidase accessory protein NosD
MRALASSAALVVALALVALLPRVAQATPGLDACTGVLRPDLAPDNQLVVATPGTWCLDRDHVWTADAPMDPLGWGYPSLVKVTVDDVTIDCRGHRLEFAGTSPADVTVIGIAAFPQLRRRLVVRNCHLRGFTAGVMLSNNLQFIIEDNVIEASRPGADVESDGALYASGVGIVRRNRVRDSVHKAIKVDDTIAVLDNVVDGVVDTAGGSAVSGIEVYAPGEVEVRGNVVRGLRHDPAFAHVDAVSGVIVRTPDAQRVGRVRVHDNILALADGTPAIAINCIIAAGEVRFADNVLTGVQQDDVGCTDAGDNDVTP